MFFFFFFLLLLRHTFWPGSFSGNTSDTSIIDTPLEPLRPVDLTFGSSVVIVSQLWG